MVAGEEQTEAWVGLAEAERAGAAVVAGATAEVARAVVARAAAARAAEE